MNIKKYDFHGGFGFFKHYSIIILQKLIVFLSKNNEFSFFSDGVGYIDQQIKADGLFERGAIEILRNVALNEGKTNLLIDVGANIDNHTVGLAETFDMIECFEPHPALFKVLEANLIINNVSNATTNNYGLGKGASQEILIESKSNHGLSKVASRSKMGSDFFGMDDAEFSVEHKIQIEDAAIKLAGFGERLRCGLIKIDVEGMEGEILNSVHPVLTEYQPIIAFEWAPSEDIQVGYELKKLKSYDFFMCRISQPKNFFLRHISNFLLGRCYSLSVLDVNNCPT